MRRNACRKREKEKRSKTSDRAMHAEVLIQLWYIGAELQSNLKFVGGVVGYYETFWTASDLTTGGN